MSARTTVTLDEDVLERVKLASKTRGESFRATLNDLVRLGLAASAAKPKRGPLQLDTSKMGVFPGLNYDCTAEMLEYAEGPENR